MKAMRFAAIALLLGFAACGNENPLEYREPVIVGPAPVIPTDPPEIPPLPPEPEPPPRNCRLLDCEAV